MSGIASHHRAGPANDAPFPASAHGDSLGGGAPAWRDSIPTAWFDAVADGVVVIDARGRCLYANHRARQLLGERRTRVGAKLTSPPPASGQAQGANAAAAFVPASCEGSKLAEVAIQRGPADCLLVTVRDREQWQARTEALRREIDRYRRWLRRLGDPILVVSPDLHLTYVTPAAAAILGRPAADLHGLPIADLVGDDGHAALAELAAELGADGERTLELRLDRPDDAATCVARVAAVGAGELLLRLRDGAAPGDAPRHAILQVGELTLDFMRQQVRHGDEVVRLTPIEFGVLAELANEPGRIVSPEDLLASVWGPESAADLHLIRTAVWRLRRKLEADAAQPRYVVTAPGKGYRLEA